MTLFAFSDARQQGMRSACILPLLLASILAGNALGQSTLASVVGNVFDPSGSVVPNCVVRITNMETTSSRSALTDAQGSYIFVNLEPGKYQIDFQVSGFQGTTRKQLQLAAKETV